MNEPDPLSIGDDATFAGARPRPSRDDLSLGDERTLGSRDAAGLDTVLDDVEIVELEARYTIEGTLGQGGMGAVVLATDTRLGRKVAIKRILGEAARSKAAIQRFLTEAKAIAALNHPNVVQIYDYGRAKDGPFLIMEYVDGGNLLDRCRDGALPLEQAIDLACQICDGLAKAHDLGIVHRDIKPANVLLTADGTPKLTDFGLAKAVAADHQMTLTGVVMGTPDFMPPEQRRDAGEVDHRSDLWSLAASVYQMVTGRSPRIIRFNDVPAALQEVLAKALEDRKAARYQSARELREALKKSLRVTATVETLIEGQCPSCGVKNESSRRFCRGCAQSLEAPCLACEKPMPLWEEVCGACGAKQTPLVDERRQAMADRQAEAEGALGDFAFDRAAQLAEALRDEPHRKLAHLSGWAGAFLAQVERAREEQTRQAVESIEEAVRHEAAHDHISAHLSLEAIPEGLRSVRLPGARETASQMLSRVKQIQAETQRLESRIRNRLAAKALDELLPDVERLLGHQPDRQDLQKMRAQLLDRQQKQAAARDAAVASAKASLAAYQYETALATLSGLPAAILTPEVAALREDAERLVQQVRALTRRIKDAVAAKAYDGLMATVEQYLRLRPSDADAMALRSSLVEREEKAAAEAAAEAAARLKQARELQQACRFGDVIDALEAIPESRRSAEAKAMLSEASRWQAMRKGVRLALKQAGPGRYREALAESDRYRADIARAGFDDPEIHRLAANVLAAFKEEARAHKEAERAHEEAERIRSRIRAAIVAAVSVVSVIGVIAAGIWIRSAWQTASLDARIRQGRFDAALALDPTNARALLGRAQARLALQPPQIAAALADLDKARITATGQPIADVSATRARALALRALEHAGAGRLGEAARDLAEAKAGSAMPGDVASARAAIVAGWIGRATDAIGKADDGKLQEAMAAAKAAGATAAELAPLSAGLLIRESLALMRQGDAAEAGTRAMEALRVDASAATAMLNGPGYAILAQEIVKRYRATFEAAVEDGDWSGAMGAVAAAQPLDAAAGGWVEAALASYPGDLSAVPGEVLARLPPTAMARLPTAVLATLPPIRNSLGLSLKLLPAGRFMMGQLGGESDEAPHEVTLTKPFYLGVTEVTNAQWQAVMGAVPSRWRNPDRPVEEVSWEEANEFCRKLSALPAEKQAGHVYRLPTEAEWEYACRAGTTTQYCFGDAESDLGDFGWFDGNSGGETHPVGEKKPNGWGLYDMHGNVWEWCSDWYGDYPRGAMTDPQGPSGGSIRVYRGGGWNRTARSCRSARRYGFDPSDRFSSLGFRLALSPSGAEPPEAGK